MSPRVILDELEATSADGDGKPKLGLSALTKKIKEQRCAKVIPVNEVQFYIFA